MGNQGAKHAIALVTRGVIGCSWEKKGRGTVDLLSAPYASDTVWVLYLH